MILIYLDNSITAALILVYASVGNGSDSNRFSINEWCLNITIYNISVAALCHQRSAKTLQIYKETFGYKLLTIERDLKLSDAILDFG